MPTLHLTKEFVTQMKQLNVFDKWKANLISQWDYANNRSNIGAGLYELQHEKVAATLLNISFLYARTPEGKAFWQDIYSKLIK